MSATKTLKEKLEEKFYITPGYWIWTAATSNGKPHMQHLGVGMVPARASYQVYVGSIPDGLIIRHKCDNRLCVNPFHLEPGTPQDNSDDMVKRGRSIRCGKKGSEHNLAKLSEKQVDAIRLLLKEPGIEQQDIAVLFSVSRQTISELARQKIWRHYASPGEQINLF